MTHRADAADSSLETRGVRATIAGSNEPDARMTVIPDPVPPARLTPIARLMAGGKWRVEAMRSLREPLLLWFTAGQGRITIAGSTRGFGIHNAIFIPAGTMHGFETAGRVQGTALYFERATELPLPLPQSPQHLRIRAAGPQKELTALLDAVQRELDGDGVARLRAVHHYLGLLSVWMERRIAEGAQDQTAPAARPDAARRLAARYTALVERDVRADVDVADFAAALGVTPTHLTRACKAACGRAAHELLQDRLHFEARRLLTESEIPVKEIARRLGFSSPAYFSRAFHHRTGMAPSVFRRSQMRHTVPQAVGNA